MKGRKKRLLLPLMLAALCLLCLAACGGDGLIQLVDETAAPAPTEAAAATQAPAADYTGEVTAIELNQALSYGIDVYTGTEYLMDSLVAERDTMVFTRLSEPVPQSLLDENAVSLSVTRDGEEIGAYLPSALDDSSLTFSLTGEAAAALTEGSYRFEIQIGSYSASREAALIQTRSLKILLVPITGNFGGDILSPTEGWQEGLWHLQACFPLANDGIQVQERSLCDLSGEQYDLNTEDGLFETWLTLKRFQGSLGDYDAVIGFVSSWMGVSRNLGSYTAGDDVFLISMASPSWEALISHHMAHLYGVGDEYAGGAFNTEANQPPFGLTGTVLGDTSSSVTAGAPYAEPAEDYGFSCSGTAILPAQVAYDTYGSRTLDTAVSFMGSPGEYATSYWVTSSIWEHLYTVFSAEPETEASGGGQTIQIQGVLDRKGEFTASAWWSDELVPAADTTATSGDYRFDFLDAEGTVLGSVWFEPDFQVLIDPPAALELTWLDLAVACPDGTAEVILYAPVYPILQEGTFIDENGIEIAQEEIVDYDGEYTVQEIWSITLSENAPTAEITNVNTGATVSGSTWIEWTGSDADEDTTLYYELYYVTDGARRGRLVYTGEDTSAAVNMDNLEKSETAQFLLRCSDGFHSSVYLTGMFTNAIAEP